MIPGQYYSQVEQQTYITSLTTSVLPQLALSRFLDNGDFDHHLRRIKSIYQQRRDIVNINITSDFVMDPFQESRTKRRLKLWVNWLITRHLLKQKQSQIEPA